MLNLIVISLLATIVVGFLVFAAVALSYVASYVASIYRAKDDEHD